MARTLHLLIWITVVTASAYKCEHTSDTKSDSDSRINYGYPSQEPIGIPSNRAYERMNKQSADISLASYLSNVPDDEKIAQLRAGQQTPTRTENQSKVLSWKPYAETRRGQNTDKIVLPGPSTEEFQLEIPEHCKRLGFCEDIPNYPQEQAKKVISELSDLGMFQDHKLDLPDVPDITQRAGALGKNIELCEFDEKRVYPKAAEDSSGKWYPVLNHDDKPIQGFKVEICKNVSYIDEHTSELKIREEEWQDLRNCSGPAYFKGKYEGRCTQKFVYQKMVLLNRVVKSLKVPTFCLCVARNKEDNNIVT